MQNPDRPVVLLGRVEPRERSTSSVCFPATGPRRVGIWSIRDNARKIAKHVGKMGEESDGGAIRLKYSFLRTLHRGHANSADQVCFHWIRRLNVVGISGVQLTSKNIKQMPTFTSHVSESASSKSAGWICNHDRCPWENQITEDGFLGRFLLQN